MSEPLEEATASPKDHLTGSGSNGEPSSDKAGRHGRGVAIPHYIASYKLAADFMPRDEEGYYLTVSFFLRGGWEILKLRKSALRIRV